MVPLNTTTGRPLGGGRRPEDAPAPPWGRAAVSRPEPAPVSDQAVPGAPAGLPEALAAAVLGPQAPPAAKPKAGPAAPAPRAEQPSVAVPAASAPAPERDQDTKPTTPQAPKEASTEAPTTTETTKETALVAVESPSAADAAAAITWLGVTFRPPDVWRERQPSLKEEWEFVMDGSHLPEAGLWRAAARGYAAPAIAVITALHVLVWVLRSPARHATAWAVLALVLGSAAFML
ncbi:hypothetical protein [Nocardiopsis flavescens]